MEARTELLEELVQQTGCTYISDLRDSRWRPRCRPVIVRTQPEEYTLEAWNEAASYILNQRRVFDTQALAKEWMLKNL